jgi:glutaconate CoA-transferase, subunit A
MQSKLTSLAAAVSRIPDDGRLAIGGNTIHRGPGAAVHEIVRQGKRGLDVIKTAGTYDIDLLCATGCASSVSAGYVGYETVFGLAPSYRAAVESGAVTASEHACYTVISGLRAAIQGVPFMPVAGMFGSDLLAARDFRTVTDPYTGEEVVAIAAIRPDVAIIHVQEADALGNARIVGTVFEDVLMAQAADYVIVTAERIVDGTAFLADPALATVSSLYVDAVVEAPNGAWPLGCAGEYEPDLEYLTAFVQASRDQTSLREFIREHVTGLVSA